jgi:hypothetical protein
VQARPRPWWLEPVLLLAICAIGLFVRVYDLRTIPPGLYNDEAAYAMDARAVVNGARVIFFEANSGREPLFIYLLAAAFALIGENSYTVRLTAALIGAMTVPATWFMVRAAAYFATSSASGHKDVALQRIAPWMAPWVSLLLALSYWHLSLSRLGFRAITLPLVLAVASGLLFRMLRRLRNEARLPWSDLLLVGFFGGLTLYTYTAGRVGPVLIVLALGVCVVMAPHLEIQRRSMAAAAAVCAGVMAVTMLPLLLYFGAHPYFFLGHAREISVLNREFGGGAPVAALWQNALKFVLMFFSLHDPELRHDPALRPVLGLALSLWLLAGMIIGLLRWKRFTLFYFVLWTALLAAPSMLSASGAPSSLRAIGMMPAVFVLPVAAMLWVGMQLAPRHPRAALLVPLPFVLLSGIMGVRAYFTAFADANLFQVPFLVAYRELGEAIHESTADTRWIIPLAESSRLMENRLATVEFLVNDPARYAAIWVDPAKVGPLLQSFVAGARQVNVIELIDQPQFGSFVSYFDSKNILGFLLGRDAIDPQQPPGHGSMAAPVANVEYLNGSIPYKSYILKESPDFTLPATLRPADINFAGRVQLLGLATGAAGSTTDSAAVQLPGDDRLWAVLAWRALQPLDDDLKSTLLLLDADGRVVAQVDELLNGDDYPARRTWRAGEETQTYHLLTPLPGTPPGVYTLALGVYEEESRRVYPAAQGNNAPAQRAVLGTVQLLPPRMPPVITPQHLLTNALPDAEIRLVGYDLPRTTVAPGEALDVTLYWQSALTPTRTLEVVVDLVDNAGLTVAQAIGAPGGGYATTAWLPGTIVRNPRQLLIDAQTAAGHYTLRARLMAGAEMVASFDLAAVSVAGRSRTMAQPVLQQLLAATFGGDVRLVGANALPQEPLAPGDQVEFGLVWQPLRTGDAPLMRSVQILSPEGALVAQQDTVPCTGQCPAASWLRDEFLQDTATLALPPDLPPGVYRIVAGWYNGNTQMRLSAVDGEGDSLPDNLVLLAEVLVGPK